MIYKPKLLLWLFLLDIFTLIKCYSNYFLSISNNFNSNYFLSNPNSNYFLSNPNSNYFLSNPNSNYFLSNSNNFLSNSNSNKFNSNYFLSNSNNFLSNYFLSNSNKFNSNSNNFNSNLLITSIIKNNYISYVKTYNTYKASSLIYSISDSYFLNKNNYISYVKTYNTYKSSSLIYSFSTSTPSLKNTLAPTLPKTLAPTLPKTLVPTLPKTLVPTLVPKTLTPTKTSVPIMSFDTKLSFNNFDSAELDENSQNIIIIATANSMNISASFLKYIGSNINSAQKILKHIILIQNLNIIVLIQVNIPLQGQYLTFSKNPSTLYSLITSNLINSVNSGLFTVYLQAASSAFNSTNFANSTILSVQNDNFIIQNPKNDSLQNKIRAFNTDIESILYVILFSSLIIMVFMIYFYFENIKQKIYFCINVNGLNVNGLNVNGINVNGINVNEISISNV